jgi:monofunctional biosynthetic peptidoglycan transglycosylase
VDDRKSLRVNKKTLLRKTFLFFLLSPFYLGGILFILFIVAGGFLWWKIPSEEKIKSCLTTTMFQVELCPTSKNYIPLNKMSKFIPRAVVATEDGKFYQHQGFDWESIERNARDVVEKGSYKRGGSTISQQLTKNMFLYKDKSFYRKGIEALITWKIENTLTKKEILEKYLNIVEFGKNIYGVKAASFHYFKKHPSAVNAAEAAFLAMLLPNPVKYSRSYQKKDLTPFAKKRVVRILKDLQMQGQISEDEYYAGINQADDFFGIRPPPPSPEEENAIAIEESEEDVVNDLELQFEE